MYLEILKGIYICIYNVYIEQEYIWVYIHGHGNELFRTP